MFKCVCNCTCCNSGMEVVDQTRWAVSSSDSKTLRILASGCLRALCRVTVGRRDLSHIKSTHIGNVCEPNTFLVCAAPFHIWIVSWLLACLTSRQHASVSQRRIYSDKFTCGLTETEVANQNFYLIHSPYTDTGLQWLPCQAPGLVGSAVGLVGPVSVCSDWVRWKV